MKINLNKFKFNGENPTTSVITQNTDNQLNTELRQADNRRDFIKKASLGGLSLSLLFDDKPEQEVEFITQKVKRAGKPSDLKITDIRVAVITGFPIACPILRIDTNQGISGYGEIRSGVSTEYGVFLKSQLLGKNPCEVEKIFKSIKQFDGQNHAIGGIEMALWDLAGKAYEVPAYQMLGGKFRDQIRIYGNIPKVKDPIDFPKKIKNILDSGLTFLKMDLGIEFLANISGALINADAWNANNMKYPFLRTQITDKGLEIVANHVGKVRETIGYDMPLAINHFGYFDVNTAIRLGKVVDKYQLAWLEDLVPWQFTEQWKQISDAIDTPTITGKGIYLKEEFIKLINARAVDMIHPDLVSTGGLLETKKIGDYAQEHGVSMAMHFAGTPFSFMANIHCAAATENFVALEHHEMAIPWWEDLFTGEKPIFDKGFVKVPEKPGLGLELNETVVKEHLKKGELYFAPTEEWNKIDSWDRDLS